MPAGYPRAADEGNEIAGARRAECSYARRKCVVDGDGGWVEKEYVLLLSKKSRSSGRPGGRREQRAEDGVSRADRDRIREGRGEFEGCHVRIRREVVFLVASATNSFFFHRS